MTTDRRQNILQAAEALFLERDYGSVSIADIRKASRPAQKAAGQSIAEKGRCFSHSVVRASYKGHDSFFPRAVIHSLPTACSLAYAAACWTCKQTDYCGDASLLCFFGRHKPSTASICRGKNDKRHALCKSCGVPLTLSLQGIGV
ncbi:hypothetical protein [Novosphingobium sp. HII-3]|uniref:hypothetical protein n=1 Tax=Novosphingobium sp. HII-3 TaxID=2075565 RepID=UPI0011AF8087|nr:hypothetical protein [Novosphingobium sp. HII-3]